MVKLIYFKAIKIEKTGKHNTLFAQRYVWKYALYLRIGALIDDHMRELLCRLEASIHVTMIACRNLTPCEYLTSYVYAFMPALSTCKRFLMITISLSA